VERLGDILLQMKACSRDELRAGLQAQSIFGGRLGTTLVELGIVNEEQLASALSRAHGVPCVHGEVEPDVVALAAVPPQLAVRYGAVPLASDDRLLRVAVADPRNLANLDDLAFATGRRVEAVVAAEARLSWLLRRFYGIGGGPGGPAPGDGAEPSSGRGAPLDPPGAGPLQALPRGETLALLDALSDPVALSALLVRGAAAEAGRAVFLKVRGAVAEAWLCAGPRGELDVRGVEVLLGPESPFGAAVALRAPVLVPVRASRSLARFYVTLGGERPMNAFVAPVVLRDRAVALLYADGGPGRTLRDEVVGLLQLTGALDRRLEALAPSAS
jgi:hypothetical protein